VDPSDEVDEIAHDLGLDRSADEKPPVTAQRTPRRNPPIGGGDQGDPSQAPYPPKEPLSFRRNSFGPQFLADDGGYRPAQGPSKASRTQNALAATFSFAARNE
jgi:hypothetical protein